MARVLASLGGCDVERIACRLVVDGFPQEMELTRESMRRDVVVKKSSDLVKTGDECELDVVFEMTPVAIDGFQLKECLNCRRIDPMWEVSIIDGGGVAAVAVGEFNKEEAIFASGPVDHLQHHNQVPLKLSGEALSCDERDLVRTSSMAAGDGSNHW